MTEALAPVIRPRSGGRPTRAEAEKIEDRILDVATGLFFRQGFAATSMEQVAAVARISKRTLYARFHDKGALFHDAVERQVGRWRGSFEADMQQPATLAAALRQAAEGMLRVALEPEALALHRIVVAEAERFPELARTLSAISAAGAEWLSLLLRSFPEGKALPPEELAFAAEQFVLMVVSGPRRRALGLGRPLAAAGLTAWIDRSVGLFLGGLAGARGAPD